MLNLDTEDWGELFIGCAGGGDTLITLPVALDPAPSKGFAALDLRITGVWATELVHMAVSLYLIHYSQPGPFPGEGC
jgi:hypothetical protein